MDYYTCENVQLPQEALAIPYAYTASCKNIYNSSLYLIRQLATSYTKISDQNNQSTIIYYELKENLHKNKQQN